MVIEFNPFLSENLKIACNCNYGIMFICCYCYTYYYYFWAYYLSRPTDCVYVKYMRYNRTVAMFVILYVGRYFMHRSLVVMSQAYKISYSQRQ